MMMRRLDGRYHKKFTIPLFPVIISSDIQVVSMLQKAVCEVALSENCYVNVGTHLGGYRTTDRETDDDRNMATVYFNDE
jgi:hypothetical protein